MNLPSRLTITGAAYTLDGGTTCLRATDEGGREHHIKLVQYASVRADPPPDAIPGRLYFDGQLVPQRSAFEAGVLALLRSAEVRSATSPPGQDERTPPLPNALVFGDDIRRVLAGSPGGNTRALTARVVQFVESDLYLTIGRWAEMASDPARYDVRAAWDEASRNHVVVRLGRLLGVGLRAAGEIVDQGRPLAQGLTALDVVDLAKRYRAAGLGVRVTPEFRWELP